MWWITLLAIAIALWLFRRKRSFSYLKELGIPGPEPNILFGNLIEMHKKDPIQCHKEWFQKYGKVFGYYHGTKPIVTINDVEILKKIQVSDFHNFMNRPINDICIHKLCGKKSKKQDGSQNMFRGQDRDPRKKPRRVEGFSQQLVQLRDKRWKEIRSIMTPAFTTSKMKQMTPIINNAIDSLLKNVDKKASVGESFDIYPMYQGLTMDIIGRTVFGIQTDVQNDPTDPLLRSARVLLGGNSQSRLAIFAASFRKLEKFWSIFGRLRLKFQNQGINPFTELITSVRNVIEARRRDKKNRRPDLLQSMIDAEVDVSSVTSADLTATDDTDTKEKKPEGNVSGKLVRKMTDDDILDNSVLLFLAGYETTSTALAFTTHFLVHHQDVQEKVGKEVRDLLEREGELDYYSVNKLQYLDQVIHESLRLYPPIYLFVSRECGEDVDFGTFKLKKGLAVQIPVYILHRDPNLWPDPDEFKPERFAPENKSNIHPMAFQAFGAGPRNCVGMRFALMEAKLALSKLLSKYRLKPCSDTDGEPITLKISSVALNPKKGIHLKAIPIE